jgi:cysteine desulfurase / selenocysteine lyase
MGGGDMIREVHLSGFKSSELPWKFEAGTPSIAQAIGLGAAVDYLSQVGMDAIHQAERAITTYAMQRLPEVKGLRILGPSADKRGGLVAFTLEAAHPHDIAAVLDNLGIAVRAGHHCAQPLHERFNIPASARASFYLYNTKEEVDLLVKGLHKVVEMFAF